MINPLEFFEREEVVNMSFIEIKGLSKIFLQGNQKIYGIRNVNISIERGTFMSVIGRSGSGKSTFLNLVGGIENPTSGEVFFDGKSIHQFKDKEFEYSYAAEPPVQFRLSHLSRRSEPL